MSVLINMEMPKEPDEWIEIAIFGDGNVIQTGESWRNLENGKCYYATTTPEKFFKAVPVPEHGDLIDRDALLDTVTIHWSQTTNESCFPIDEIEYATTIIPASEGGET